MIIGTVNGMIVDCKDELRREMDQRIADVRRDLDAVADRAAAKAVGGVMEILFGTTKPSHEQIATFHIGQSVLRRGAQLILAALAGGAVVLVWIFIINNGHQALDVAGDRMGIERPVIGQVPRQ